MQMRVPWPEFQEPLSPSGGRKAANYIYGNARPDGLTVGALSGGIVALNIMGESDAEVIDTLKKLSGAGPLPAR